MEVQVCTCSRASARAGQLLIFWYSLLTDLKIQNAIQIAWNPASEQSLKAQAFDFLNSLRTNPSAASSCLTLFSREPRTDEVVRPC